MTQRLTGQSETECPACYGMGVTQASAPEMELKYNRELGGHVEVRTIQQGSGCLRCGGTGQLA